MIDTPEVRHADQQQSSRFQQFKVFPDDGPQVVEMFHQSHRKNHIELWQVRQITEKVFLVYITMNAQPFEVLFGLPAAGRGIIEAAYPVTKLPVKICQVLSGCAANLQDRKILSGKVPFKKVQLLVEQQVFFRFGDFRRKFIVLLVVVSVGLFR